MIATLVLAACLQAPTLDADAGFQGTVFADSWTRFSATIAYEGEPLDAELRVTLRSYSSDPVVYRRPLRLMRKVRMRTGFDLYVTSFDYTADVELVAKEQVLRTATLPLNVIQSQNRRLLVVGPPPAILIEAMTKQPPVTLVRTAPELLPGSALTLRSVDAILIPEAIPLDLGQEAALEEWIQAGGRLIFGSGRSTVLKQNPFWKRRCSLESPEVTSVPVGGGALTLVRGKQTKGRAGSSVAGGPLTLRDREGLGEVVFVTVLLDQPGLSKAVPAASLLAEVLDLPPPPKEEIIPRTRLIRRAEWQLQDARAQRMHGTPEILRRLIPPEWTLSVSTLLGGSALVLVYMVLIGPVEYWRLRRGGRLRQGWRSLAVLVLVFGGLVFGWAGWASPRASQFTLVSILDAGGVRTFGAFRPSSGDVYEMKTTGSLTVFPPSRAYGARESTEPTSVTPPSEARLPIPPSETRLFVAARPLSTEEAAMSASWSDAKKTAVTVRNAADFALEDCWAVTKDGAWPLGRIAAGATVTVTLENPVAFHTWASRKVDPLVQQGWRYGEGTWAGIRADCFPAALGFHELFYGALQGSRTREVMQDRTLDWSGFLNAGGVVVVGSFDRNVSGIEFTNGAPPRVYGLARLRVQEAGR